jgi:hypothetical protein
VNFTQPGFATGDKLTMSDVVVKGFRKEQAKGKVFFNPMQRDHWNAQRIDGSGFHWQNNTPISCSGSPRFPQARGSVEAVDLMYASLVGLSYSADWHPRPLELVSYSSLGSMLVESSTRCQSERGRSDGNLWETLAESNKALGTLTGIFGSAYKAYRSRNFSGFTKEVSQGYLGWRYGVKPLISDVSMVIDGLTKKVGRRRKTTRATSASRLEQSRTLRYTIPDFISDILEQSTDEVKVRAMSLDEHVVDLAYNLGLTSKGLLTLPWELVNKSFVLDWFVNVGDFIGALTPAFSWTSLGSCYTIDRRKLLIVQAISNQPGTGRTLLYGNSGGYKILHESKSRVVGLPHPSIVVKSDFRFDNITRCLDALTLLASRVLK